MNFNDELKLFEGDAGSDDPVVKALKACDTHLGLAVALAKKHFGENVEYKEISFAYDILTREVSIQQAMDIIKKGGAPKTSLEGLLGGKKMN